MPCRGHNAVPKWFTCVLLIILLPPTPHQSVQSRGSHRGEIWACRRLSHGRGGDGSNETRLMDEPERERERESLGPVQSQTTLSTTTTTTSTRRGRRSSSNEKTLTAVGCLWLRTRAVFRPKDSLGCVLLASLCVCNAIVPMATRVRWKHTFSYTAVS